MSGTNYWCVLIGGVAAGLIIIVGETILNAILLGAEWNALRTRFGLPALTTAQMTGGVLITILYGIFLVWLYAAIRPRFGPGPRTAVIAGLAFWLVAYVFFLGSMWNGGMVTVEIALVSCLWGLVEAPVAAVAGAWLYQEQSGTFLAS